MSESFFLLLLLLGIIVEWVEQSHGKAESWLRLLAPRLTSCDSGQETWLQPRNHSRTDWEGELCEGLYRLQSAGISEDWEGYPAAKPHAPQPVSSGQVVKRELFKPKP